MNHDYDPLWQVVKILPTDYTDYGGTIERWKEVEGYYPDCSTGCRFWKPLKSELGCDWGVCGNPNSPRAGLLTFEHQTGVGCFK
jgi:hypothetical protein